MSPPPAADTYNPLRAASSQWLPCRGQRLHLRCWGTPTLACADRPPLLLLHGWMDVAASFQFLVDAMAAREAEQRWVIAPDWRGFGLSLPQPDASDTAPAPPDTYWFPDYLADLDAIVEHVLAQTAGLQQLDLLGHSMGGNVAMHYAGLRPQRLRRLVNLEGFGLPRTRPEDAPRRLQQWLDELRQPAGLRDYASAEEVAARLQQNNPLLPADKAAWLARHWARQHADGRWHLLADPSHKRAGPLNYQVDEALAVWRRISTPLLWAEGDRSDLERWWGRRYPRSEFYERLAVVPQVQRVQLSPCGHMLHHDQPEALAGHLLDFLRA